MNSHKLGCPRSDEYSEDDCTCNMNTEKQELKMGG